LIIACVLAFLAGILALLIHLLPYHSGTAYALAAILVLFAIAQGAALVFEVLFLCQSRILKA